jgi:hypothetical protein
MLCNFIGLCQGFSVSFWWHYQIQVHVAWCTRTYQAQRDLQGGYELVKINAWMDAALWEKVFENFVQGDASTTRT